MPEYDFHHLSPYDMEVLARDLLQAHWQLTLENFKSGRDGGIDLRYSVGTGNLIVQVKHYAKTGVSGLLRDLEKEAVKVRKLKPKRYALVTTVELSPSNVDAIVKIFGSEVLSSNDVFGQQKLNNLLGQHSEIEIKHFKLWLASVPVLQAVLNNAVYTQSRFKVQQIHHEARRYVQNDTYRRARRVLEEHRVVIISGPPGVGKSTLADLLLYEYVSQGYEAVVVQQDIREAKDLFNSTRRQVFHFDDFVGATFVGDGSFAGANDRALVEFISMIKGTPKARLILTTRDHLFQRMIERSERLRQFGLEPERLHLSVPSYSLHERAEILYNHIYFSDLTPSYKTELIRDQFYMKIIKHKGFNPRVISWLSSLSRVQKIDASGYRKFIETLLKNPFEIWRHAYYEELSDAARSLLLTIYSLDGKASMDWLRLAFAKLHQARARKYNFATTPEDFHSALRELDGPFIKAWGSTGFEVLDPSVLDFLNSVFALEPANAIDVLGSTFRFEQIERMWLFSRSENSGAVINEIRSNAKAVALSVAERMMDNRRIPMEGGVAFGGVTFERRYAIVIQMTEALGVPAFGELLEPLSLRLQEEWRSGSIHVSEAAHLLQMLNTTKCVHPAQRNHLRSAIEHALLAEAEAGCNNAELRDLIEAFSPIVPGSTVETSLQKAFVEYGKSCFRQDLEDCNSAELYEGLIDDLRNFSVVLKVDAGNLIAEVEFKKDEFEEEAEAYADAMQDEWKERWRAERYESGSVADMFDSLARDDRQ